MSSSSEKQHVCYCKHTTTGRRNLLNEFANHFKRVTFKPGSALIRFPCFARCNGSSSLHSACLAVCTQSCHVRHVPFESCADLPAPPSTADFSKHTYTHRAGLQHESLFLFKR